VEGAEEAKHPGGIQTGSRVLTSAEFLAGLAGLASLASLAVAEPPVVEEDEGVYVDLLDPKDKALGKLTAETEEMDPTASGRDWGVI
jgi:hypothetical protein